MTIPKNDAFEFLDRVRESGQTNMFGAGPYLEARYGLSRWDARQVLIEWMESYALRQVERQNGSR